MADKKEIEEALKNFPNEAELNMDLVSDAENLTRELYCGKRVQKPRMRRKIWEIAALSLCFCALLVGIIVPLAVRSPAVEPPVIHHYSDSELVKEQIFDMDSCIAENAVNAKSLSEAQQTFLYRVIETNQPVIILQEYSYNDENDYDIVKLEICLTDDRFNRYEIYQDLSDLKQINGIEVKYNITQMNDEVTILAYCQVDTYYYYFEMQTLGGEERIDYYINYLFK